MHDIRLIRENPEYFDAKLALRGIEPLSKDILAKDEKRRSHIEKLQEAQARRNAASKEIGQAKAKGDESRAQELMEEVSELKSFIQSGEEVERQNDEELTHLLSTIPNLPMDDVPLGDSEDDNVEIHKKGTPKQFDFEVQDHIDIGEKLQQLDFDLAAQLSGARFVILKDGLARLERAIAQFMLDTHSRKNGYMEIIPPYMVQDHVMYGTGQLPKFAEDLFKADNHWLIPTAEVPLTNMVRESILNEKELPLRFTAYTPCFRSEAGSAGRDTRGMIRQHQFTKVELVSITKQEDSEDELMRMLGCAEGILDALELPYRTIKLCTGDMGFGARRTYDIEVWLPGQNTYREISSCSTCGDFQARRMNARYRVEGEKNPRFVHTLNGSGLAVGRTMIAIMENYQNADGSITIPEVLRPYFHGETLIK